MSTISFLEKVGGLLPWVREHRRLRDATRYALAQSEAYRHELAVALNALRLRIRRESGAPDVLPQPRESQVEHTAR